ncbi:cornifelin homolog B-like [Mantella aurantiaca]
MSAQQVTMTFPVNTQPQMVQLISTTASSSSWNSDVFDCFDDCGVCLCGTFFPLCLACKVASDYGECCCLPVLGGAVLAMRTGIRERHRIPGTICNDCVCLTFCGPCTVCQMSRELKVRK